MCANVWRWCQFILNLHKQKPKLTRKQIEDMFRVNLATIASSTGGPPVTDADLLLFLKFIDIAVAWLTGQAPKEPLFPKELARFMNRAEARQVKPRKFKAEHLEAYQAREQARREGKTITNQRLAKRYMQAAYERKPESAIRAMGNTLKRIERDIERVRTAASAPSATEANAKMKHKNVGQR
jgi:hypothetical protein